MMRYALTQVIDYASPDFDLQELIILASSPEPDASALFLAADITDSGFDLGEEVNFMDTEYWLKRGADIGDPLCMAKYGAILIMGRGVEKDQRRGLDNVARSKQWLIQAAGDGHPYAQSILGVLMNGGLGMQKNSGLALEWYAKAAAQGERNAIYNLGLTYTEGTVVKRNAEEAKRYLTVVAEMGHAGAQHNLGKLYLDENNIDLGLDYLKRAANQSYSASLQLLAECYGGKRKIGNEPVDTARALELYTRLADQGDAGAAYIVAKDIMSRHEKAKKAATAGASLSSDTDGDQPLGDIARAYDYYKTAVTQLDRKRRDCKMSGAINSFSKSDAVALSNSMLAVNALEKNADLEEAPDGPMLVFSDGSKSAPRAQAILHAKL